MGQEDDVSDETQQTPAGHEIRIPSRGEVFRDLEKVARGKQADKAEHERAERDEDTD
jgi:hypothetical protein